MENGITREDVLKRAEVFLKDLQDKMDFFNKDQGLIGTKMSLEPGSRYIRVVQTNVYNGVVTDQRSAYAFIDTITGDLLKPAGWKTPAKHARSNIFTADCGLSACGQYGVAYLR